MVTPIVLILGAGARVGQSCAHAFKAAGYKVAIGSRSLKNLETNSDGFLEIRADLSDPSSIPNVFESVEKTLGAPPSVVIYNAAARRILAGEDPLSTVDLDELKEDFNINVFSSIVAAKHAVAGFAHLPETASKTYINTGNLLNILPNPAVPTFGAGKASIAHFIEAMTRSYAGKGYKFYYPDQRWANGASPLNDIDGEAHGKVYVELAQDPKQRPWHYTFVKDVGCKVFTVEDAAKTAW